ncbi:MAG: GTP-binding protein [Clostridia bacterium]|nr:GTP-binding protein [Clostridia bacterium]
MIKVDIISGFLGAGKTTLIKKLFETSFKKEKVALIENEFGEIGIDGTFLKESGIEIKEINSGCICCSLVGNFEKSLQELIEKYSPDRIIIEPSGVGKLSEVVKAVEGVKENIKLNILCTVVDGGKCKMYFKNFGEFYVDQISEANTIVVSKTDKLSEEKVIEACEFIKQYNPTATLITTPITQLNGKFLLENLEDSVSLVDMIIKELKEKHGEHHHHHHHDEDCECEECKHEHEHHHDHDCCEHEHHHDEDCECEECKHEHDCCEHEHHHHDEDCECEECKHEHEHHHDHDCCEHEHHHEHGECCCHHHHEHDADEVFASWGKETVVSYSKEELESILTALSSEEYGIILRSKGVVKATDSDSWYYFDYVSGDFDIKLGTPDIIGKLCVIGSNINKEKIENLFNVRG